LPGFGGDPDNTISAVIAVTPQCAPATATRRSRTGGAAAVLAALALLAGCATVASPLPAAGRPMPAAATSAASTALAPAVSCGDPTASIRPPAVMPTPGGAMPAGSLMATIARRGWLVAGVRTDVPPFDFVDPRTGQFSGVDIDIATDIAAAIFGPANPAQHIRFRAITTAERIPVLQDNEVDIVVATMTVTCSRRAQVNFSVPYYDALSRLLVVKTSPFRSLADLGGRKVCAAAGTTSLQHVLDAPSHPVPYVVANGADCLVALQDGTVDAVVNDDTTLDGMIQQDPNLMLVGPSLAPEPEAVAMNLQHPEMTRFVNGVLAQIEQDGVWAQQMAAHLGTGYAPAPTPVYAN
jgi:polar amino acid transport system substrate-binding protein